MPFESSVHSYPVFELHRLISAAQEYCTNQLRNFSAQVAYTLFVPRPSPVTDAVRDVFEGEARHAWSIDQLHESVRTALGGADYSTVFRAVATMEREGLIRRIDLGDGKAYYEADDDHHEHIRCESCGRIAEVPGCVLRDAASSVQRRTGFRVTSHQIVFNGLCPACAKGRAKA
jgi:Fe2+ or Zn2+ uptake regulation protein